MYTKHNKLIHEITRLQQEIIRLKSFEKIHISLKEQLQISESRYRELSDLLPVAVFEMDINATITFCNMYAYELTGYNKEDFNKGFNAIQLIVPEERAKAQQNILKVMKEAVLQDTEYKAQKKDGTIITVVIRSAPITKDGKTVGVRGVIIDITERKQIEEELKKHHNYLEELVNKRTLELNSTLTQLQQEISERKIAEESFFKAFNYNPNAMAISAIDDGKYLNINDSFLRISGYSREEVIGLNAVELGLWDQKQHDMTINLLKNHYSIHNFEATFHTKSGERRIGLFSAEAIELNGKPYMLRSFNDITEKRKFEKEITRLDRLSLIGEMAAGIGHEIRNPMTTVRGFLQILRGKANYLEHKEHFDIMIQELDRANDIITEFLSLAKNKLVTKELSNINSILKTLAPLIQADAFKDDKFTVFNFGDIPDLMLDEKEMRQLILNLTRNGLEAMLPSGTLTINTYIDNSEVVLSIQDEGTGISQETLEKIGTPFFTTKENGTGLGLAICYSIASRHNASIKVDSSTYGTTISVHFKEIQGPK